MRAFPADFLFQGINESVRAEVDIEDLATTDEADCTDRMMRKRVPGLQECGGTARRCDRMMISMMVSARRVALFSLLALTVIAPEPSLARRSITVRMPVFDVPPRSDREICAFVPLPMRRPVNVSDLIVNNFGVTPTFATHHVIAFVYSGDLRPLAGLERRPIDDTACINFGDGRPGSQQFLALTQGVNGRFPTPRGTAIRLAPGTLANGQRALGLVINAHWINGTDQTQRARARVKLVFAKDRAVKRQLKPIFDVSANLSLKVPPGETGSIGYRWAPGNPGLSKTAALVAGGVVPPDGPACVTLLTSHMLRRGKLFTADFVAHGAAPGGSSRTPSIPIHPPNDSTPRF